MKSLKMFIPFSCTLLCDRLIPDICCCDSHRHISYLTLTCIHLILAMPDTVTCHAYHLISDTGTGHAYHLISTPVLAMLYLTPDT